MLYVITALPLTEISQLPEFYRKCDKGVKLEKELKFNIYRNSICQAVISMSNVLANRPGNLSCNHLAILPGYAT